MSFVVPRKTMRMSEADLRKIEAGTVELTPLEKDLAEDLMLLYNKYEELEDYADRVREERRLEAELGV